MNSTSPRDPDILESYVLGLTNPEESAQVETLMANSAQVREEVDAIRRSLEDFASAHRKTPRAALKAKVWSAVQAATPPTPQPTDPASLQNTASVGSIGTDKASGSTSFFRSMFSVPVAALFCLSVAAVVGMFVFRNQREQLRQELERTQSALQTANAESQNAAHTIAQQSSELAFRNSPNTHSIALYTVDNSRAIAARVYLNPSDTLRFVALTDALHTDASSHLVLWAFVDNHFVAVHDCSAHVPGKLVSFSSVPTASEFMLSNESSALPDSTDKTHLLAMSSNAVLRGFVKKRPHKQEKFVAGYPRGHSGHHAR